MVVRLFIGAIACVAIFLVLWDAFRSVVVPRPVAGGFRLGWIFYRFGWSTWSTLAGRYFQPRRSWRDSLLGIYSPLAILMLMGLWACLLIAGFGLLQWALGATLADPRQNLSLSSYLYFSGVTFFTLGFGDVQPITPLARLLAVVEAGVGFAFLALVISYLPTFYQSFSRREIDVSLLDARAGSPPTASELLRRCNEDTDRSALNQILAKWEVWGAELLESHISYPALGLFRSQHEHQSWVAALTTILDTCTLIITGIDGIPSRQAQLTFAIARHAAVDLGQIYDVKPSTSQEARLSTDERIQLWQSLHTAGLTIREDPEALAHFLELRVMYEPYVSALADFLLMPLPPWMPQEESQDAWESSPYDEVHWYRVIRPADELEEK